MRVLFVAREFPPYIVGGSAVHTFFLVKHLQQIGVSCEVLSFGDPAASNDLVSFLKPTSSVLSKRGGSSAQDYRVLSDVFRMTAAARERLAAEDFDVVHVEEPYVGALVRHERKVTTIHDTSYGEIRSLLRHSASLHDLRRILFYSTLGPCFEVNSARTSRVVITPAEHIREELIRVYGFGGKKVRTIRNGIEIPEAVNKQRAKELLGLDPSCALVFTSSQHIARKRLDTLIRAVSKLSWEGRNLKVVIGGDGPLHGQLAGLVRDLHLQEVVSLPGWLSEEALHRYYEACDVFVLTSEYEGGPISLLEAMSYGAAVVSTRIEGFPKLIRDGVDGVLFDVGDDDGLANRLRELLRSPDRILELSGSARRFARRFGWDEVARETASVYEDLCGQTA